MIEISKQGRVMTIVMNRPEARNAVNRPTADALADAFREFEADDEAYVAVLYGEGGFCAGADLKAVAEGGDQANRLEAKGDGPMGPTRMRLSKPVIAAMSGHAVAGGFELAIWCDMRVMEEDAVMGIFCRRFGVPLIDGGTVRLPRLVGMNHAMDLILTGRPVDAAEALQMGLVNRVVPSGGSREAAETLAAQIASFPQNCMRSDRLSAYEQWDASFEEAMLNEFNRGVDVIQSGETQLGAKAFSGGKGEGVNLSPEGVLGFSIRTQVNEEVTCPSS